MILIKFKNTLCKYNNIFHIIYLFDIKIQKILILTEKSDALLKNIALILSHLNIHYK